MSNDQFDPPGSAAGITWSELKGSLLLITPHAAEKINTMFGENDCVRADVVVLDGAQANEAYTDTLVFPRVLQSQLRANIGSGRMNLGRLGQGQAKSGQSAPWKLEDPTDQDKAVARAYLQRNANAPF